MENQQTKDYLNNMNIVENDNAVANSISSPRTDDGAQGVPDSGGESEMSIPLTDIGNMQRFVEANKDMLRYADGWVRWDGKRWEPIDADQVLQYAVSTVMRMKDEIPEALEKRCLEELMRWHHQSQNLSRLNAMSKMARSAKQLKVDPARFDSEPRLLNVRNGTLNLNTFELQPHTMDDLLTRIAPTSYVPDAKCPEFLAFIERIFDADPEMMAYVRRVLGYGLLGENPEQALFVLHGDGANGKSILLKGIRAVLGPDLSTQGNASMLMATGRGLRIRDDLANLKGYRLVSVSETDDGGRLDESLVKWITGGEPIRCRRLYHNEIVYEPQFTIYLATNHRPAIRDTDKGIWRRMHIIPFGVIIPDDEQEKALSEKLAAENEGILAWLLDGLRDYWEVGLCPPEAVTDALKLYREESDVIGHFLNADCECGAQEQVGAREIYDAYRRYAFQSADTPLDLRQFKSQMQRHGFVKVRTGKGIVWRGVKLSPAADPSPDAAQSSAA